MAKSTTDINVESGTTVDRQGRHTHVYIYTPIHSLPAMCLDGKQCSHFTSTSSTPKGGGDGGFGGGDGGCGGIGGKGEGGGGGGGGGGKIRGQTNELDNGWPPSCRNNVLSDESVTHNVAPASNSGDKTCYFGEDGEQDVVGLLDLPISLIHAWRQLLFYT